MSQTGNQTVTDALTVRGTVQEIVTQLPDGPSCAAFMVAKQQEYAAIVEVWRHVRAMILLEGKGKPPFVTDDQLVCVEPDGYQYNVSAVQELAPEVVRTVEVATSKTMQEINGLAGNALSNLLEEPPLVASAKVEVEEILRLSQSATVTEVDGRLLPGILARGDARAQELIRRGARTPVSWKITVRKRKA